MRIIQVSNIFVPYRACIRWAYYVRENTAKFLLSETGQNKSLSMDIDILVKFLA